MKKGRLRVWSREENPVLPKESGLWLKSEEVLGGEEGLVKKEWNRRAYWLNEEQMKSKGKEGGKGRKKGE